MSNIRKSLSYFGKSTLPYYLWLFFSSLVSGLAPVLYVYMPKLILDELLGAQRPLILWQYVAILALGALLLNLLRYFANMRFEAYSFQALYVLTEKLTEKTIAIPCYESESKQTLDFKERAKRSLDYLWLLKDVMMTTGSALVTLVSSAILILSWKWWLLPLLLGINLLTIPLLQRLRLLEIDDNERSMPENRVFTYFTEISRDFRYAKDLRLYNGVDLMLTRAKTNMDKMLAVNHEYFTKSGALNGLIMVLVELQSMLVFLILGTALMIQAITIDNFVLIYNAARQFGQVLSVLFDQTRQIMTIDLELASFIKFMALPEIEDFNGENDHEEIDPAVNQAIALARSGQISLGVRELSFAYPEQDALILDNLSLSIPSGETVALVGRNGAGKTTLVKLICRLYQPQSGQILLNGVDIAQIPLREYYKLLSVTFQDFQLMPILLSENLCGKLQSDQSEEDLERIRQALRDTEMLSWAEAQKDGIHVPITRLLDEEGAIPSGGQEQKLAIARNICHDGALMILDEPTSALDPRNEEQVFRMMLELTKGGSSMFVSHRLSSTRYADRIFVLDKGRLIQEGNHARLIEEEGLYRTMYLAQASQYQDDQ